MLNQVRKELERLKLLNPPVIHLHSSLGDQIPKLKAMVSKLGGTTAENAGQQSGDILVSSFFSRKLCSVGNPVQVVVCTWSWSTFTCWAMNISLTDDEFPLISTDQLLVW
jgi:hypothetical protein